MQQGDIVIINFPFTSLVSSKIRPALIISNEKFNQKGVNLMLLAISTQPGQSFYSAKLTQADLTKGTLLKPSFIRFSNILSLEKKLIIKKVGELSSKKSKLIIQKLIDFLKV